MWERMLKLDLAKVNKNKSKAKQQCSSSRIENKKIGHFQSIQKQNIKPMPIVSAHAQLKTQPSPTRQKQGRYSIQTQAQQSPRLLDNILDNMLDNKSTRIVYSFNPSAVNHKSWMDWQANAIQYKNQLQSYKSKLYAAEYQINNLETQHKLIVQCEAMRYEKRIEQLKGRLADRDAEIRQKDQIIKNLIGIAKNL